MKYIDADRLRAEIERRIEAIAKSPSDNGIMDSINGAKGHELMKLLSFIDTLEEPEQPTRGYDEAYLNEKIAKASKSWKGVDVDKFMDEIRGREPVSDDLEEAAKKYETKHTFQLYDGGGFTPEYDTTLADAFKVGAEWQKAKMLKDAVEGEVHHCMSAHYVTTNENQLAEALKRFNDGDKVRIIILPKEDGE